MFVRSRIYQIAVIIRKIIERNTNNILYSHIGEVNRVRYN